VVRGGFIFGGKAGFAISPESPERSDKEATYKQQLHIHGLRSYILFFF